MKHMGSVLLIFLFLGLSGLYWVTAQDDTGACPALVTAALQAAGDLCGDLDRNEACYGHNRVDALFWQEQAAGVFSAPADRVSLLALRQVATAPLSLDEQVWGVAVLHLQADVPDTLPGQAVTVVLLGDASLANEVSPDTVAVPVAATAITAANLRSGPSTSTNVVGSVAAGTEFSLLGANAAGDWYEVRLDTGGSAWVFAELVAAEADALAALRVSEGPHYGPMQAFYFSAGLDEPACAEAPNALIVQSPGDATTTLRINDLNVTLGSTVIFTIAARPDDTPVLVGTLLEGRLSARFGAAIATQLTAPGESFAVTLNAQGRVDASSQLVELAGSRVEAAVQQACQNAASLSALEHPPASCDLAVVYQVPDQTPEQAPASAVSPAAGPPQPATTGETSSAVAEFDMVNCGRQTIRAGNVRLAQGLICDPNIAPVQEAAARQYPIAVDGVALPTYYSEIMYVGDGLCGDYPAGYQIRAFADWVATAGTHVITSSNYHGGTFSCTVTVAP